MTSDYRGDEWIPSQNHVFSKSLSVLWYWIAVLLRFSTRYSRKRFTSGNTLSCSVSRWATTYRDLVDELIEMPQIRDALDLDSIPAPSTLCKAFDRLEMAVWRVLLNVSLADLPAERCHRHRCIGV